MIEFTVKLLLLPLCVLAGFALAKALDHLRRNRGRWY